MGCAEEGVLSACEVFARIPAGNASDAELRNRRRQIRVIYLLPQDLLSSRTSSGIRARILAMSISCGAGDRTGSQSLVNSLAAVTRSASAGSTTRAPAIFRFLS